MMPFKSLRCGTPVEVEDQSFDGQPPNLGVEPVRILLDEQLPRQLAPCLIGRDARTVQQESCAGLKNSVLLTSAVVSRVSAGSYSLPTGWWKARTV